jgi:hypothetical protein
MAHGAAQARSLLHFSRAGEFRGLKMLNFLRGLLFFSCMLFASEMFAATTLKPLAKPNLSGLHTPARLSQGETLVDSSRGLIYFHGFTHVKGIPVTGVFRADPEGNLDYGWLPQNLPTFSKLVLTASGDLIGLVAPDSPLYLPQSPSSVKLVRVSAQPGAAKVVEYEFEVSPRPSAQYVAASLATEGGSLIVALREQFTVAGGGVARITTLRKIDLATDMIDSSWSRTFDGDVFVDAVKDNTAYTRSNFYSAEAYHAELRRIAFGPTALPDWTVSIPNTAVENIAVDTQGRAYAAARFVVNYQSRLEIHRIGHTGNVDPEWRRDLSRTALERATTIDHFAVVDDLLVVSSVVPAEANSQLTLVAFRFAETGNVLIANRFGSTVTVDKLPRISSAHNAQYLVDSNSLAVLSIATMLRAETSSKQLEPGYSADVPMVRIAADGSRVITGRFAFWFGGVEYRHFVWIRADGTLRAGARAGELDAYSASLIGPATDGSWLARFFLESTDSLRSPDDRQRNLTLGILSPSDANVRVATVPAETDSFISAVTLDEDGLIYYAEHGVDPKPSIKRVSAATRQIDLGWRISVADPEFSNGDTFIESLNVDAAGGIWVGGRATQCSTGCFFAGLWRFDSRQPARSPERFPIYTLWGNPLRLNSTHAYINQKRFELRSVLIEDLGWWPPNPVYFVDDRFVFFESRQTVDLPPPASYISRASTQGDGNIDPVWRRDVNPDMGTPMSISRQLDGSIRVDTIDPRAPASFRVWTDQEVKDMSRNVVEFSYENGNRFFITGRSDEIALLDSNPQLFTRTGVSFAAAETLYQSDDREAVCRFFVPQAEGRKATHFYGRGLDCQVLNSLPGFIFEGFDFTVGKVVDERCGGELSQPVTRMFNNKSRTGEGNHRYIASASIKRDMLSRGWIDEGVAFCARGN